MKKEVNRQRRKMGIRKKISGTALKPRIFVFKSNKYLNAGVADDIAGKVLIGAMEDRNSAGALKLADAMSKMLKDKKIDTAVFDRSGYRYHGILTVFVDQLRKNGIKI